jgi:O-methyltransferase involved in polyketide biosynthesis
MTDSVQVNLGNVQKTLFLPLWGRAVESKKSNPLLIDPTAVKILDQVDYDFSLMAQNMNELSQIAWIKRSLICDQTIKKFLVSYPDGTIVNIGCGLDTTYERVDNGQLRWYDLDLPDVIELRSKFVKEDERRKFIASSFLEKDWLNTIEVKGNVLFIAAGVFYYFKEQDLKNFIIRLLNKFPKSELLFDVCSPVGMRIANKRVVASSGLDEKSYLTWGLKSKKELLSWDPRIKLIGTYHYFRTLGIGIKNFLMGTFSDLLGIQYMLHLGL